MTVPALLICLILTILPVGYGLSGPSPARSATRRLHAARARHGRDGGDAQVRRIAAPQDSSLDSWFWRLVPRPDLLRRRLAMTGRDWTLSRYAIASGGIALAAWVLLLGHGLPLLLVLLLGLAAGLGLPHLAIGRLIRRRITGFTARFPDAIELMVRGLRSGLPVGETLGIVAGEIPGPVGQEFRAVCDRIRIGRTMDQALQDAADRLGTTEMQFFAISLTIQRETGGNLAETLSNLAEVLRKRGQMTLKVKAMSSEARASAWIIGVLPLLVFGLIAVLNPAYMQAFATDPRLAIVGIGSLLWMGVGVLIMAKMIDFEV